MPAIKSAADIAGKWARVTPARAEDYRAGVERPLRDWGTEAQAAAERWGEAITAAVAEGRFARGVSEAGTEKWRRKAIAVGPARWGPGVRVAQPDYQRGFEPFRNAIEAITLPPRRAAGDPANIERVSAIASALHALKTGRR